MKLIKLILATLVLFLVFAAFWPTLAQQPTPMPQTFVHDFANVIPDNQEADIQTKATRMQNEFKTQVAFVTVPSLNGQDSFDYSLKLARDWKIGSKEGDVRGLLILVAPNERKISFRTSSHLEGDFPDSVTGAIGREMGAYFKRGDWGGGSVHGMNKVVERAASVHQPATPATATAPSNGISFLWLLILIVPFALLIFWLIRRIFFSEPFEATSNYSGTLFNTTRATPTQLGVTTGRYTPSSRPARPTSYGSGFKKDLHIIAAATPKSKSELARRARTTPIVASSTPSRSSSSRSTSKPKSSSSRSSSSRSESSTSATTPSYVHSYTPDPAPTYTAPEPASSYNSGGDTQMGGGSDNSF
jgi:uncharacterized protein